MLGKIKRFLILLDDLAEVLVVHVLFSRRNWWKTTGMGLLLVTAFLFGTSWIVPAPSAACWAKRAEQALAKRQYKEAVSGYKRAVKKAPKNNVYREQLGIAQYCAGQVEQAVVSLTIAYRKNPSVRALYYLGCVHQSLDLHDVAIGYFNQLRSQRVAHRADMFDQASSEAYDTVIQTKIAQSLLRKGRKIEALQSLRNVLATQPHNAPARFHLGVAYWELGSLDLAVEQFFRVIELYPQEAAAYYNVACYYSVRGQTSLSLAWLERALAIGFDRFGHIETDHDLDAIRPLPRYRELMTTYRARVVE